VEFATQLHTVLEQNWQDLISISNQKVQNMHHITIDCAIEMRAKLFK